MKEERGKAKVGETLVELRPCRVQKWDSLACVERIIPQHYCSTRSSQEQSHLPFTFIVQ